MEFIKQELVNKLTATKDHLVAEFATVRSGRANPGLLDKILVDVYGQKMPISNLATVTVPDPKQLLVQPWDKANTSHVEKALLEANLGFGVANEGTQIRLALPLLSNERREELVKQVNRLAEDAKVSVRNIRREAFDALNDKASGGGVSDDDKERLKKEWQHLIDGAIENIEQMTTKKSEELRQF
ncbi:ribosome recycling factor [Patescibacteria group bacterium]|nr:ribosome recycling factor [Patescibacteria group bacterium]